MCPPRTVTNAQLSRITNLVNNNPALTASQVAQEVGIKPRKVRFYLTQLRGWGWVPEWQGRQPSRTSMSTGEHQSEINNKAQFRKRIAEADEKWAEIMGGRSYA